MSEEKINEQIVKLEIASGNLGLKIAANKIRLRNLIGKRAGVKVGDIVRSKGTLYRVVEILSDAIPKKGKPVLSGLRIAKNGNLSKRPVEIEGAWSVEGAAAPKAIVRAQRLRTKKFARKPVRKAVAVPAKRRGRLSKKSLENYTVLGTA